MNVMEHFGELIEDLTETIYDESDDGFLRKDSLTAEQVALKIWKERFTKLTYDLQKLGKDDPEVIQGMCSREVFTSKVRLHLSELMQEAVYELYD